VRDVDVLLIVRLVITLLSTPFNRLIDDRGLRRLHELEGRLARLCRHL
jgi:hypothetical protein